MMKQHHMFVRAYTSSRVHDVAGRGPLALKPGRPVVQGEHNARGGGEEWWEGTTERGNTKHKTRNTGCVGKMPRDNGERGHFCLRRTAGCPGDSTCAT